MSYIKPTEMEIFYAVYHIYEVDGGFGDPVEQSEFITAFKTENEADKFIEKFNNPHVPNNSCLTMWCGELKKEKHHFNMPGEFDSVDKNNLPWCDR